MTGVALRFSALGLLALAACEAEAPTPIAPPARPPAPPAPSLPPSLLQDLRNGSPAQRRDAVQALSRLGPAAAAALPDLALALEDRDAIVRRWAATTCEHLGPAAQSAALPLSRRLTDDPDPAVREAAGKALLVVCPDLEAIRPAVQAAYLREQNETVLRYVNKLITLYAAAPPPAGPAPVHIGKHFRRSGGVPLPSFGSWPGYRGADADGVSREDVRLADRWPAAGPTVLWTAELGEGYSGPAVHLGRVYLLDYDPDVSGEGLRCLSLCDGAEIWRRWSTVPLLRNHGFTRSTPAVNDDVVVAVGVLGHVLCADMASGELRWSLSLRDAYGAKTPNWYGSQSPLLDGPMAVFAVGGPDVLLAGVHCDCGSPAWTTPNPGGWTLSHASVVPAVLGGRNAYLYAAPEGVAAVSADPGKGGRLLWTTSAWSSPVQAPSPVPLSDGAFFLTAGYGRGSALLQSAGGAPRLAWTSGPKEGLSSEMQTPVYHEGSVYLVVPRDGGPLREQLVCLDPWSGSIRWASGRQRRFGALQPFVLADGKLYVLDDEGTLTMVRARCDRYEELGRAKVLGGRDAWGPPALADGRLLLRDETRLLCLDLR